MSRWQAQVFLQKTTSRPLKWAILSIFAFLIIVGVLCATVKVQKTISAKGELKARQGAKDLVASAESYIRFGRLEVGDTVEKDAILARLVIPQTTHEAVGKILEQLNQLHVNLLKREHGAELLASLKSENVTVNEHLDRIKKDYKIYQEAFEENKRLISKKVFWIRERRQLEEEKLKQLRRSAGSALLQGTILEIQTKIQELSQSEYEMSDEIDRKTQNARNTMVETLRREYIAVLDYFDRHLVKAPIKGTIARKIAVDQKWVQKGEILFSILPANDQYIVVLKVPNEAIGKIRQSQDVRTSIDAYSYQKYGQFVGKVQSINQLVSKDGSYFEIEATVERRQTPFSGREIASDLLLYPGMSAESSIVLEKQTIFQSLSEKLFHERPW